MTLEACKEPLSYEIQLLQFEGAVVSQYAKEQSKRDRTLTDYFSDICDSNQICYKDGFLIPKNITRELLVKVSAKPIL